VTQSMPSRHDAQRRGSRRAQGAAGRPGLEAIVRASVGVMTEHGYHGTSVRDIAERAGVTAAALYHHFASKHDILVHIMECGIDELLRRTTVALENASADPVARLRSIVAVHVLFHLEDQRGTMLGTSELRALQEPVRSRHIAKRQRQQRFFKQTVAEGVRQDLFHTAHPVEAARAVVVMCTGVASWYKPTGRLSHTQIARRYQALALDLVGYRPADGDGNGT
jgi:AcrR family transcriptional regulator